MMPLLQLQKITGERGWRVGEKVFPSFLGWPENREFGGKMRFGASYSMSNSYCLLPDTFWLQAPQNAFKFGSVKLANSLSPPSIVKKVAPKVKAAKGLKWYQAKVKGVNNPAWTAQ